MSYPFPGLLSFSYVHSKPINGYLTKWAVFNIKNSQITRDTLWKLRYFFIENLTVFFIPKSQVVNIPM